MARIFVSSTFKDLEECRKKVSLVLRQMGHEDVAMEYFVAEDKRPLDKCLDEVASSDLYVGIFAWRYGYRPPGQDRSITELEYRKAVECRKNCLLFLLHEDAPWPRKLMDKGDDASKIEGLRNEFSTNCIVSFFESSEDLARKVGTAVHNWEINANLYAGAQDIPEIDIQNYTKTVAEKYRNLDIDTLTPIQREEYLRIKLGNVFVEQYVRENPPPFEIPKNVWKRIQEEWDPEKECFPEGFCAEDIKNAKEKYYSKDPKPIFDVIINEQNKYLVILGDPGSGKSTLARYILLSVLNIIPENKLNKFKGYVPLLIELRKFTALRSKGKCETFLDYFKYRDETAVYDLSVEDVEKYLKNNGKAILIFDGMDEIFDPEEWEETAEMIAGFKNRYPKINVIVTSRIIGYKNKILNDSGFSHFTIQDFEKPQIETFLDKWYSVVFENKEEIEERKARIFRSLEESSSIRELAGNPLLLTILAIIGKHRELPRERWELYEHATDVLVEHWDINRHLKDKRINTDFIGRDEKKALLMKIAFKMQSGPEGFAGNFIHRTELENEIEEFIESNFKESPSNSRIIARHMIDQLRERNFILCLYGADFFGFVHRTFLEYFCAKDIVTKFDNHELDIKRLQKDYYSKYWKDPAWHEVLRLICGMKDKFAGEIIEYLMQVYDPQYFGDKPPWNIVLATKCLSELKNPNVIEETAKKLLERILKLFEMVRWTQDINQFLAEEVVPAAKLVGDRWPHQEIIIDQFSQSQAYMRYYYFTSSSYIDIYLNNSWAEFIMGVSSKSQELHEEALRKIKNKAYSSLLGVLILGKYEPKNKGLFSLFLDLSAKSRFYFVRMRAVQVLARSWHDDPETLMIIKRATVDEDNDVRKSAVEELAWGWHDDPETLKIIKRAITDENSYVRKSAVQELARGWHDDPETLIIIKERAITDENSYVRKSAVQEFARGWHDDLETYKIIKQWATIYENNDVRMSAVQELARGWHDDLETYKIIKQWAKIDKNIYVRMRAVQELAQGWHDDPETINIIKQRATIDKNNLVRDTAVQELARGWHNDPETLEIIKQKAIIDESSNVRMRAVQELAKGWHDDPETLNIIKQRATIDKKYFVRMSAIQELAKGWHDDPETFKIIKQLAKTDKNSYVRKNAVQELARGWHDNPETLNIIKQLAKTDKYSYVRKSAVQELARGWYDDPETLNIIKQRATIDESSNVRMIAVQELAQSWYDDPETLNIINDRAMNDDHWNVRKSAVQELARGWHEDPETLNIIKDRAMKDENEYVRQSAVQELKKWWGEDAEENTEENVSSEIITQEDSSISDIENVENVSEYYSGDVKSENIEVDNVQTSLDSTDCDDENTEVTENIEIPERIVEDKVDNHIQVKKITELKVNSDSENVETLLVSVSKREKEIIRIAAVQLNFKLSDTGFPPQIIDKNQSRSKVLKALKMACDAEADIVCLPELCICKEWIPEIKDACQNMAVIAGSYYDAEKHNVCQPLLDSGSDVPSQIKIIPSPFEEKGIISQKMIPGDRLHIYDTKVGKFSVLICRDFINLRHQLRGMTDIIFVPSYNKEIKRFHEDANNHINNGPAYIVISNTSLYGGTSVFGRIRKELNSELVDAGYKAKDDGLYKLCELREGEEGLIIADFNLVHKSIQVPTPANPAEDIRPVPHIEKKVTKF